VSIVTTIFSGPSAASILVTVAKDTVGKVFGGAAGAVANSAINAIGGWVLAGAKAALDQVAHLIGAATSPDLAAPWFSSTYWRVAGLAALLTVPFIFAAMLQAILRSDLALIGKVVFTYLPVSVLSVSLAAPVVTLLLSATDQMCSVVSSTTVDGGAQFLEQAGGFAGGLAAINGSPFFAVTVGLFAVAAALMLLIELTIRAAAVYVVVLLLPLAFAAFVWPARRIWAVRLVELLISLILSKFVIVAVLSLAGSALATTDIGVSRLLTATALLLLSTFAPWALLRILPFTELGAGAAGALRHELLQTPRSAQSVARPAAGGVATATEMALSLPARLRRHADEAGQGHLRDDAGASPSPTGQDTMSGEAAASQPASPVTGSVTGAAMNLRGEGPADPPAPSSEPVAQPKPDPLAHIPRGSLFDLSRGMWIEPDDND